jgi:hypothetical protein
MEDSLEVHGGKYFPLNCNQEVPTLSTAILEITVPLNCRLEGSPFSTPE